MKRILFIPIICLSFLFYSCDDIFHNASSILEEISDEEIIDEEIIDEEMPIPEPVRIFIGGDFYYDIGGFGREALIVTNGHGNREDTFFSGSNHGLLIGSPTSMQRGVNNIKLTDEFIYVGGNFMGYDIDNTYTINSQYQMVQRYWRDGSFDTSYIPFGAIPGDVQMYSIEPLADGTQLAGGNFGPYTAPNYFGETELIQFTSDGNGSISTFPSAPDLAFIYSLESIFEDSLLAVGGSFNNFGSEIGLSNFAVVDPVSEYVVPASSLDLGNFPSSTEVRDFASWNDSLYVVANETAMSEAILFKYTFDGSSFIADTAFNDAFNANITDPMMFDKLSTISVDDLGRIYIGGQFWNQQDENGEIHENIMRITTDGRIDPSFKVKVSGEVFAIEIQMNGKVLIGGSFSEVNYDPVYPENTFYANGLVRITENGDIDYDFDYSSLPGGIIYTIAIEEEPEPAN